MEIGVECSSCRVKGQKSKLSYRHTELDAVKVKKKKTKKLGKCSGLLTFLFIFLFSGKVKVFKSSPNSLKPHGLWPVRLLYP